MVKMKECPMCRQTLVDLSNNPMFVNHDPPPPKEITQTIVNFTDKEESKDKKKDNIRSGWPKYR